VVDLRELAVDGLVLDVLVVLVGLKNPVLLMMMIMMMMVQVVVVVVEEGIVLVLLVDRQALKPAVKFKELFR
jgi:hypothetical protein